MFSIQIASDLHLEAPKSYDLFNIIPKAPCLALIGDIGCIKDREYLTFLEKQLRNFKIVFLILGNHEPYHSDWESTKRKLKQFERDIGTKHQKENLGSLIFMDQTRYNISPNITVLGCTLFSNVLPSQAKDVSFGLNDFYNIDGWTVEEHTQSHIADFQWLNAQVKSIAELEPKREIIILTHYSPTIAPKATDPAHSQSKISSGFSTDLSGEFCWTSGNVKAWAFGHTHFNCDFVDGVNAKRVLTNQRGYCFKQSVGFDATKCIELKNHNF
ncbi:uncharacterized protein LY89DRAFT_589772 [Mollisia scopiformis]|uniref:Calcineurin-like phosphoesterase domain-containing protein n=1 Tax=Mollisia scopiformis TaxID=149040 RepID=A0A194X2P1_MOLSC|nr:uncharacterized protein LY89DRAFT_589772 [Mollisia scopiformis]KUJ14450.1 hypothetical protein LY89DRAFT_589772 [Mollisia scopiformis]